MRIWFLIFVIMVILPTTLQAAKLESLIVDSKESKDVVILTFQGMPNYKSFSLQNPTRVVFDFKTTQTKINFKNLIYSHTLVKLIRSGHPSPNTLRIVFDLATSLEHTSRWIESSSNKHCLQIVFSKKNNGKSLQSTSLMPAWRDIVVVIDPGHGGKDPGAIGYRKHAEKDVVLAIARRLKNRIDKQAGMRAILTRSTDQYIGLRERLLLARKANGDVFISLHADAFSNRKSKGSSVFALSQTGATSEAARWLAEKENHSELGGVNLSDLDDQNGLVRTVLIDLSQTATIAASLRMGNSVLNQLGKITTLHNNKVEQARFVVLKSPDIPSILVETGFISNPGEEQKLANAWYQERLTQAVFEGVRQYFWEYPPRGTWVEAWIGAPKHLVRRGDSLSQVASRYHVSKNAIVAFNQLPKETLQVGQTITIPKKWA